MAKAKLKTFTVTGVVTLSTAVDVQAATWEDAVQKARELKVFDFVTPAGEHLDSELAIESIWRPGIRGAGPAKDDA